MKGDGEMKLVLESQTHLLFITPNKQCSPALLLINIETTGARWRNGLTHLQQ